MDAVSSLSCLICVGQRPCARKGAISHFLRTKITPLDANSIKTGFGATSGEPSSGSRSHLCCIAQAKNAVRTNPTCVASPTKQKMRYGLQRQIVLKPGFGQNQPLTISLGHSALCALSLAPCSPLKPPKGTPRPDELNQVMI